MKKAIRITAVILVTVLFTAMALGSGSGSGEVKEPSAVNGTAVEQNTASGTPAETAEDVSIEEIVLVDEANVKVTAKSFETDSIWGPQIKFLLENNTDQNLTFSAQSASVNGYMADSLLSLYAEVAAGKKANETMSFTFANLKQCGITTIADVEFKLHIYNSDSWDTYLDTDVLTIKTSAAEGFNYVYDNSGHEIYNANGIEIVVKGLSENDSIFGPGVILYISNTSGKDVCISDRGVSVNGFMTDAFFSCEVLSGKHAVDAVTFFSSDLEDNGIEAIEDVELSFHIYDSNSWNTIADTDPITISFN